MPARFSRAKHLTTAAIAIGSAIAASAWLALPAHASVDQTASRANRGWLSLSFPGLPAGGKAHVEIRQVVPYRDKAFDKVLTTRAAVVRVPAGKYSISIEPVFAVHRIYVPNKETRWASVVVTRGGRSGVALPYTPVKSGTNLQKAYFYNVMINGYNLSRTSIDTAGFTYSNVAHSKFDYSSMASIGCSECIFSDSFFRHADWNSAQIFGTLASDNFTSANMAGLKIMGASTGFAGLVASCTFKNANLQGADFSDAVVKDSDFSGADLTYANFNSDLGYAYLEHVRFVGANLTSAYFGHTEIDGIDLTGANLSGTGLAGVKWTHVKSGGIIGTPKDLPSGWTLVDGTLVQTTPDPTPSP